MIYRVLGHTSQSKAPEILSRQLHDSSGALLIQLRLEFLNRIAELPTLAESGLPGFEIDQWYGVITNAKVSPAIVNKRSERGHRRGHQVARGSTASGW